MSLVTRCPACHTKFKVVRDQLRISDGWVRCGRCSEVFDASLNLRETPDEGVAAPAPKPLQDEPRPRDAPATSTISAADPPAAKAPSPPESFWPAPDLLDLGALQRGGPPPPPARRQPTPTEVPFFGLIADEPWPSPPPAAATVPPPLVPAAPLAAPALVPVAAPAPAPVAAPASDLAHAALPLHPSASSRAPAADIPLQKALRRAQVKAAKIAKAREKKEAASQPAVLDRPPVEPTAPVQDAQPLPSFLESKPSRWRWRPVGEIRPRALMAAALLAAVLLVLQVLRHERDVLAARQPELRPMLLQLCALTGCQVAALRRIGSIAIDGAAFSRERIGEGYRLSFTLRNDAAMPLAMPAIELSLLDTQERAVVRRVLMPADFGAPPVLDANAERSASLALSVTGAEAAVLPPVAGYRVVAFYP
jgi:predicted Zn finger-like uncharacterized protein